MNHFVCQTVRLKELLKGRGYDMVTYCRILLFLICLEIFDLLFLGHIYTRTWLSTLRVTSNAVLLDWQNMTKE